MKTSIAAMLAAMCVTGLFAQGYGGATKVPAPKAPASASVKTEPPAAKKAEPPAKVEGLAVPRKNGGFMGIQVKANNFVFSFYDKDKKKIPADVVRAAVRWEVKYQPTDERAVLNVAADGKTLTGPQFVRPPLNYRLYISLFAAGQEAPVESFVADYKGE